MTPRRRSRRHDEGSAVIELTWLVVLLMVPLVWVVLGVFEVQRGAFGTSAAARSAARAYALAPTDAEGERRASAAAARALADQGVEGVPVEVKVTCTPFPQNCHSGTSVITVRVDSRVTLPMMPDVFGSQRPSFAFDASHSVPIGQYQEIG